MKPLILYHGTSQKNAEQIKRQGFATGKTHNWGPGKQGHPLNGETWAAKSKKGFIYLSTAYAPFYAMATGCSKLALIKVSINPNHCYPEDDFLMRALGKSVYTQKEFDNICLENYKQHWKKSLAYMGNVAAKPKHIQIIGIRHFNGSNLFMKCDPSITPMNFVVMGKYYQELSDWIFEGKEILEFNQVTDIERMFQNGTVKHKF